LIKFEVWTPPKRCASFKFIGAGSDHNWCWKDRNYDLFGPS